MIDDSIYVSASMRILPLMILFIDIPFIYKLIPILLFDKLDCMIPSIINIKNKNYNEINCQSIEYQQTDKIMDTITYFVLLIYVISKEYKWFSPILIILFIFRIIGTLLYLFNNDRKTLFYFPNFFLPTMIIYYLLDYINPNINKIWYYLSLIPILMYKILNEYIYHVNL
jgi:hypothetical protein